MTGRRRLKVMVKSPWLVELERAIRRDSAAIRKLDERKVELDIEARRHDIHIARRFVAKRLRLNRELDKIGIIAVSSTPAELDTYVHSELERWGKVIKDNGNLTLD